MVATKGLALLELIIEINIFGVRDDAVTKKQIIDHKASEHMRLGAAAVRAGDLLCLSALYAADANGALPQARNTAGLKYFGAPAHHQMRAILAAADEICRTAGTSLANVLRVNHFVGTFDVVYPALRVWQEKLAGASDPVRRRAHPGADAGARLQHRGGYVGLSSLTQSTSQRRGRTPPDRFRTSLIPVTTVAVALGTRSFAGAQEQPARPIRYAAPVRAAGRSRWNRGSKAGFPKRTFRTRKTFRRMRGATPQSTHVNAETAPAMIACVPSRPAFRSESWLR